MKSVPDIFDFSKTLLFRYVSCILIGQPRLTMQIRKIFFEHLATS